MPHSITTRFNQPDAAPTYRVLGDRYTFRATGVETNQTFALIEIQMQPQSGTPLHRHSREAESFYVQSGQVEIQLGDRVQMAGPGTLLYIPIGQWHRLTNIGETPAHLLCWLTPAGAEHFFMQIGNAIAAADAAVSSPPVDLNHVLATANRYGIEISPPSEAAPPVLKNLEAIAAKILEKQAETSISQAVLVAISGIDGSGKGYVTAQLVELLRSQNINAVSINLDAWHTPLEMRHDPDNPAEHFYRHAFRFDEMFQTLIEPLRRQRSIHLTPTLYGVPGIAYQQTYDFQDADVVILEGIFLLKQELRPHYDLTFWIDCTFETALERALQRNQEGLPPDGIVHDYHTIYFPAERVHLAVDDPRFAADGIYFNDARLSQPIAS